MSIYAEPAQFIKDKAKLFSESEKGNKYKVNQEFYKDFMKSRGITDDTMKQINEAQVEYNNATVLAATDIMKENPELSTVTINTRTSNGVISTRLSKVVDTRIPKTKDHITKYGVVSIKMDIQSRLDPELLKECADAIKKIAVS